MSDLQAELEQIDGVGEKTAEKIMAVVAEHGTPDDPLLEKAKTAAKEENTHKAIAYLKRL
jgi:Holliday junction resolvasome RuvABC DNA-binding subunit